MAVQWNRKSYEWEMLCPAIISLTKCLCQVCYYCHACAVALAVFVVVLTTVPPTFSPWFCEVFSFLVYVPALFCS